LKKLYGLIGFPLGHSFSEKYFTTKFEKEGVTDAQYKLFPIESINDLQQVIKHHPDLIGLNVTIPYKKAILKFATHLSEDVKNIGAANTLKLTSSQIIAYNTDITGFERSLVPQLQSFHKKALILGTGGASTAIQFVFKKLGIEFLLVSRTRSGDQINYEDLNEEIMNAHLIVINTTPLGTFPDEQSFPPIPYSHITQRHYCFDLVYNPIKTVFLTNAEKKGAIIKNGYDMLVIQAEESWKIWNSQML
jgi:shikimate dehydrogenase